MKSWQFPKNVASLTLTGYSKAAEATYFYIPELKIQLDMGGISKQCMATSFFITHSHMDHCIYLPSVQPAFLPPNTKPNDVYVPEPIAQYVKTYLHSAQELNNSVSIDPQKEKPYNLITVSPSQNFAFGKSYHVTVVNCTHGVPSVGYGFSESKKKLKDEFKGKPGKEIKELRDKGIKIDEEILAKRFIFLGDTTIAVFDSHPEILEYPVIIVECTFLYKEHLSLAHESYHIHWEDLAPFVTSHPLATFVLIHFSLRYTNAQIEKFFEDVNLKNIVPWISSFK
eukprot:TRINITY_DN8055_c0_g1_i1.p1 TRINITY_DN8055_c0_g1~~TRINITY_DN8055_c0_g1_i1.p1  ORF type:complete len:283 (-),score=45.42 TRINITY_DN8055_c0_g1_i1:137-985(-)